MSLSVRMCVNIFLISFVFDGVLSRNTKESRNEGNHQILSYPRDWDTDWKQWARGQGWNRGDPVPDYDYTKSLSKKQLSPERQDTRPTWVTQQRGSAYIPHKGSTVRITPSKGRPQMLYKGEIRPMVTGRPKKRRHRSHLLRQRGSVQDQQSGYSQDEPLTPRPKKRPCVRCPGDQTVMATKGSNSVFMDKPPVIPCNQWSSVKKVKSEVLAGPQPGREMAEGSHKMVVRLFRHKRTLATCVIMYNVIVRKCPEMELGFGLKTDCSLGKAWGSKCNFTCEAGYVLERESGTECSDDLHWTGVQPQCILNTACPVPISPEFGHLSCRTPQHRPVSLQGASMLPDGTVCHFQCQPGYTVPPELSHLSRMRCIAGTWDNDQDPFCVETNNLEEHDPSPDISVDDALRLDGKDCPENFCFNGGKCLTILKVPMCSCQTGYSGSQCEKDDSDLDFITETEDNALS